MFRIFHIGFRLKIIACFFVIIISNQLFSQKINVVNRFNENESTHIQNVSFDILDIEFNLSYLTQQDLKSYSIITPQNAAFDVLISPKNQFGNVYSKNENIFILYNFEYSDPNYYTNFESLLNQGMAINPFLDEFFINRYHVFKLEIFNHRNNKILLNPNSIICLNGNREQKKILSQDDLFLDLETNGSNPQVNFRIKNDDSIKFRKKILRDNLFEFDTIYSKSRIEGLLCFPIINQHEKTIEIIIPNLSYITSDQIMKQIDIHLKQ